jgi:ubiquinone biosynthesis protein UbiJ
VNSNIENLLLEQLKRIPSELAAARERDAELLARLINVESGVARVARDEGANFAQIVDVRHAVDRLVDRVERIERRLEMIS